MLSSYFKMRTKKSDFIERIQSIIENYKDKKVLIYGAGDGFVELKKQYKFDEHFQIISIADRKFESKNCNKFQNIKAIKPADIINEDYDAIFVTNESYDSIVSYLKQKLNIPAEKIVTLFNEEIKDAPINYNYLESYKFSKHLETLKKKLKNKTIVIYGVGVFFEAIKKYYNLDGLNIIGISDQRFIELEPDEQAYGYKAYSIKELPALNPDYVIVAVKYYMEILEELYYEKLKNTQIKIKPIFKKPLLTLIKEIWR